MPSGVLRQRSFCGVATADAHVMVSLFVLAIALVAPATRLSAAGINVAVTSGTAAPTGSGTLSLFNAPAVGAGGELAFLSQLTGTSGGASDNVALYRYDGTDLEQIARQGVTTLGGAVLSSFPSTPPWVDEDGRVRFLVGAGFPELIYPAVGNGGALGFVVDPGSASPSGNTLTSLHSMTINDQGTAAYVATYGAESGVYRRTATGALTTQVLLNSTAPRGGTITAISPSTINESNQVAATMTVNSGGNVLTSALRVSGSTRRELAREGDDTTTGQTTLQEILSTPLINDAGQVAFVADYTQPAGSGRGVFVADDSSLQLAAPGMLSGITGTVDDARVFGLTTSGSVGFWAEGSSGDDPLSGLFIADGATVTQVALENAAIPSGGRYIRRFFTESLAYNAEGQMAFLVELSNTVDGPASGRALLAYDAGGGLREIVKTGDALGGGTVAVDGVFFYGALGNAVEQSPDASLSGLNGDGLIGFGYELTNGAAGIATWTRPEAPGDFNGDGQVNGADLARWESGFGTTSGASPSEGDANADGAVAGADFLIWQQQSGASAAAATNPLNASVPEPAGLILALLGLFAVWHASSSRESRFGESCHSGPMEVFAGPQVRLFGSHGVPCRVERLAGDQ